MVLPDVEPSADQVIGRCRAAAVATLLDDGWRRVHPYKKWEGVHWRLLSLVELGVDGDGRLEPMIDAVLDWLTGDAHLRSVPVVDGRVRRCASQEGNALFVAARLGASDDPRAETLAERLLAWQWPDGGWNCDIRPAATHSSFHESLAPLRGLASFGAATRDGAATEAARRTGRLLLDHGLFRSRTTGAVIDRQWLRIHWPAYWHYDVLQGLRGLVEVGMGQEPGGAEARAWLRGERRPDGTWVPNGRRWWCPPGAGPSNSELLDWGDLDVHVVTTQARAVLAAADGAGS